MPSNASQSGSTFRSRHPDLWFFDKLPLSARKALASAAFDWSSGWIYGGWQRGKRGFKTGADIAKTIAEADARQIDKDRKRVWNVAE